MRDKFSNEILNHPLKKEIIITVIDENWVGQNPNGNVIKKFYHNGKNSVFLDASIDISLPSEMTNQIISRRLALANNPDEPIIRTDGGGFFSSETDLFLQATTSIDGKPRKELTEEEKKTMLYELIVRYDSFLTQVSNVLLDWQSESGIEQ